MTFRCICLLIVPVTIRTEATARRGPLKLTVSIVPRRRVVRQPHLAALPIDRGSYNFYSDTETKESTMRVETINAQDTHDLLSTDPAAVLVCAYEKEDDFRQNDLEGAISLNEFRKRRNSIPKDESVIFYCACPHDEGAIKQAKKYSREGFSNVKILEGGVDAWKRAGFGLVAAGS